MPVIQDIIETLRQIEEIHRKKNDDYATDSNPFSNFDVQEYLSGLFNHPRDKVFAVMIAVKIARLGNLLNKEAKNGQGPLNESIDDSFVDLATYTLLWKADRVERRKRAALERVDRRLSLSNGISKSE